MKDQNPIATFLEWFDTLAPRQKGFLAFIYLFCTTEDTADWVLLPEEALRKFRSFLLRSDLPIRLIVRLVMICSFFDFIFSTSPKNPEELFAEGLIPWHIWEETGRDVLSIDAKMWERTIKSWWKLRRGVLSDKVLAMHAMAVL